MRKTKKDSKKIFLIPIFIAVFGLGVFVKIPDANAVEFLGRGLICLPKAPGVYCSWRLLPIDALNVGFDVYRSTAVNGNFQKVNTAPITNSTNFHDTSATSGLAYYYKIKPAGGEFSELSKVTAGGTKNYIDIYKKNPNKGSILIIPGDLNGDGVIDFLVSSPSDQGTCDLSSPYPHATRMLEGIINKTLNH